MIGAKGTFFARGVDTELALNEEIMLEASRHHGTSVMEFLTNCVIFNNGVHSEITDRENKADRTIVLRAGEKMIFGKEKNKGIVLDGWKLKVVKIGEDGVTEDDVLVHDPHQDNIGLQMMLAEMSYPDFPVALGVIRDVVAATYEDGVAGQLKEVASKSQVHCMDDLLGSGAVWEVK